MNGDGDREPLIERVKAFRPRRAVRRRAVQAVFLLLSAALLLEAVGAVLSLAGVTVRLG